MKKIIFTSDLLKVDDRKSDLYLNPQDINIDWLYALFSKNVKNLGYQEVTKLNGVEGGFDSIRWNIFNTLGLPLCSASWAMIYEGNYGQDLINQILEPYFIETDLVCGFELPPYFINFLNKNNINYLDFTIHPIRFLPDYILGVRTNIKYIQAKLNLSKLPDSIIHGFADISKSRTVRIARNTNIVEDSVLFLGQIEIDSSLIKDGKIASMDELENSLIDLSMAYPKIYYKAHPHSKSIELLKKSVNKIGKCQWYEMNAYDAYAQDQFALVATLSSGGAYEAKYFGKKTKTYLNVKEHFNYENPHIEQIYYPIYKDILNPNYWDWLFNDINFIQSVPPDPYDGAVKFGLNMKWGR